jgi:hypothetical protein
MSEDLVSIQRRYTIQSVDAVSFLPGHTSAGEQAILGIPGSFLVAAFFGTQGDFLRHESRHLPQCSAGLAMLSGEDRKSLRKQLWAMLGAWKVELGLTPGTIVVSRFSIPEVGVELADLPDYLQDHLEHPDREPDEDLRRELAKSVIEWRRLGRFVLRWGNEYWLNSAGEVTDT